MDYHALNRARINKNTIEDVLKIRTIVIVLPRLISDGVVKTEIRFPQKGTIKEVYATCGKVGSSRTRLRLEKCAESVYLASPDPIWNSVFDSDLYLDANHKTSKTSATSYVMNVNMDVSPNDHFRINVVSAGSGVETITIEVIVELDTEI